MRLSVTPYYDRVMFGGLEAYLVSIDEPGNLLRYAGGSNK